MTGAHIVFMWFFLVISLHASLLAQGNFSTWEHRIRLRRQIGKSCILPAYPENGLYSVGGAPDAKPGDSLLAVQLVVSCQPGHRPLGRDVTYCVGGEWSADIPKCVRHCRLDPHPSVKYRCLIAENSFDEGFRDCKNYEPVGTAVKPQCNKPNYYYTGVKTLMRCTNDGRWDHIVTCTADCGRFTPQGKPLLIGGKEVERGELPWHAGIYLKRRTAVESDYLLICGGTIISTRVIISAAHCFWTRGHARTAASVAVAVGKLYRDWDDTRDFDAQKFEVSEIKIPVRYQDEATHYQDDIAAVILSAYIVYQPHVRPICMDLDPHFDRTQLQHGAIGKVAGWGFTSVAGDLSPILKVLELPYVRVDQCIQEAPPTFRPFITSDKICAGYKNGSAVCRGDSGGGLVFPALDRGVERYYLRGIVSTAPKSDDECNAYERASFTQVVVHATFIEENTVLFDSQLYTQQQDNAAAETNPTCLLPPYPRNGKYTVSGSPAAVPGQQLPSAQLVIRCNPGYIPRENIAPSCSAGKWTHSVPECVLRCTLPKHTSSYVCTKPNGTQYSCGQFEPSGVTVQISCDGRLSEGVRCIDGLLRGDLSCDSSCGVGNLTAEAEMPWSAAIYGKGKVVRFLCGATIVKPSVLVTAAQCMWDSNVGTLGDENTFMVAAGIDNPDWERESEHRQVSEVAKIIVPPQFAGAGRWTNGRNDYDLAVMHLMTPFTFNERIQAACLDLNFKYIPQSLNEAEGKAPTWGILDTQKGQLNFQTALLSSNEVVHMTNDDCKDALANLRGLFLTPDTLCVKILSGRGFCKGDSGLGFFVPATFDGATRYVLVGVASGTFVVTDRCYASDKPIGYTDISYLTSFLKNSL